MNESQLTRVQSLLMNPAWGVLAERLEEDIESEMMRATARSTSTDDRLWSAATIAALRRVVDWPHHEIKRLENMKQGDE